MIEIIPTVVPRSFDDILAAVARYKDFAPVLHIDIANGSFAPNTTWMPGPHDTLPEGIAYEAHLMVADPLAVGEALLSAGAMRLIGHVEVMRGSIEHTIAHWREAGVSVGIAMLADTAPETLDAYAAFCDAITMMGITAIGVQGLPPDYRAPDRIAELQTRFPECLVEVDGAVSEASIEALARAGARRFCVGSALAQSADPASTYRSLVALAEGAVQ